MKTSIVLLSVVAVAWGYSGGAPESVCDDMTPQHPVEPQKSPLPYSVTVNKKEAKVGDVIDVTIGGNKPFKGYLVQVRNGNKAVGSFAIPANDKYSKTINCHGVKGSAATHKSSLDKNNLTLQWKAPAPGDYQVFVTVAEDGGTFWAQQPTQKIRIN